MLGALILAFNYHPGGQVGQAHGRIRLVNMLATRAARSIGVDFEISRIDLDIVDLIGFGHDRDGTG